MTVDNQTRYGDGMAPPEPDITCTLVAMERSALERWRKGDPDGFLEISSADVSYFDPFTESRLDGLPALRGWYEQIRGKIQIEHFELIEPRVQAAGDVAVLTFRFHSRGSEGEMQWNTTEVYQKTSGTWRIIHSHWAFHRPKIAA